MDNNKRGKEPMIINITQVYEQLQREDVRQAITDCANDISENILDERTHPTNKRGLQINLSFSPNPERTETQLDISVQSKLARRITIPTSLVVGDNHGQPVLSIDSDQPTFGDIIGDDDTDPYLEDEDELDEGHEENRESEEDKQPA